MKLKTLPDSLQGWGTKQIEDEIEARVERVKTILEKDDDSLTGEDIEEAKRLNDEIDRLKESKPLPHPGHPSKRAKASGWAQRKAQDPAFRSKSIDPSGSISLPAVLLPSLFQLGRQPTNIMGLIPTTPLDGTDQFEYLRQNVRTNNAAPVARGGIKPESVINLESVEDRARRIATLSEPIDNDHLADINNLVNFLDDELRFMVLEEIEAQVLSGSGAGENIRGILNTTGIQTQAKGADPTPDAVLKAITKIRTGTARTDPDAVVFNPADWEEVALLRTADGEYIWGSPAAEGALRIWNLPVILSTQITAGTALVGAFRESAEILQRESVRVDWSESLPTTVDEEDTDLFHTNQRQFRAEARVGLAVMRPTGFCTVTGI